MKALKNLRRAYLYALKIADHILISCLKRLPLFLQSSIRENIEPTGRLDFDGADIPLSVNSKLELKRLFPCREEPGTCEWIRTHVKTNDVFYDIGANAGSYSFIAYAAAGKACKVFAFEPNPFTFASLSKNIILNGCAADVTALNMALSDETAVAQFRYSTLRSGAASHAVIKESGDARIDGAHQRILCMRLDDAAKRFALPPPSHMKIDVDGAELDVLDGSARTLARPELSSILIEIDENKDSHARVLALLENQGFVLLYKYAVHRPTSKIFNCVFERQTASR